MLGASAGSDHARPAASTRVLAWCARIAVVLCCASTVLAQTHDSDRPLRVAATASLRGPLDQAFNDWRQAGGVAVVITYAGTPALVRQIGQGLPADLFLSADSAWMDHLEGRGALRPGTRRDLLGNRLVLIARAGGDASLPAAARPTGIPVTLGDASAADRALRAALANWPGSGRFALAEVTSVPAGRYARAALETLDLWRHWSPRVAMSDNVRAALLLVARGEAELGVVYASDARLESRVRVVAAVAESLHPPIRYPAAVLATASHPRSAEALDFLAAPTGLRRFTDAGFSVPACTDCRR